MKDKTRQTKIDTLGWEQDKDGDKNEKKKKKAR
jgi:hypothetical protein